MMRVLHYVDENRLAWGETWIQLINELSMHGVENCVVCKSGGALTARLAEEGMSFNTCDVPVAWLPWTAQKLGRVIEDFKPDIIHTRLSSAARIGGWWGKRKRVPVIATLDKIAKVKYYDNLALLICCSQFVRDDIVSRGFPLRKTIIIYNPIKCNDYIRNTNIRIEKRKLLSISNATKIIVAAGRFDEGKGFEFLIEAYAKLDNKYNSKLIIMGDGPHKSKYQDLIKTFKLERNIIMPGFVQDVRPWLWASDIFVFPSSAPEAFGVALLEGMASGLPVIGTRVGGPEEIIRDGENGILVRPGDSFVMAEALARLLSDDKARETLAKNSLVTARKFDVTSIASLTANIYKSVKAGVIHDVL